MFRNFIITNGRWSNMIIKAAMLVIINHHNSLFPFLLISSYTFIGTTEKFFSPSDCKWWMIIVRPVRSYMRRVLIGGLDDNYLWCLICSFILNVISKIFISSEVS